MKLNILVLDVETGGLNPLKNPITQFGGILFDGSTREELLRYETYVKPYDDLEITQKALEASRVDMKDVNNGADITKVVAKLVEISKKHTPKSKGSEIVIAGHNTAFDIGFLEYMFKRSNMNLFDYYDRFFLDTLKMYGLMEGKEKNQEDLKYNLTALSERYNVVLENAHDAMADVEATAQLLFKFMDNEVSSGDSKTIKKSRDSFKFEI